LDGGEGLVEGVGGPGVHGEAEGGAHQDGQGEVNHFLMDVHEPTFPYPGLPVGQGLGRGLGHRWYPTGQGADGVRRAPVAQGKRGHVLHQRGPTGDAFPAEDGLKQTAFASPHRAVSGDDAFAQEDPHGLHAVPALVDRSGPRLQDRLHEVRVPDQEHLSTSKG